MPTSLTQFRFLSGFSTADFLSSSTSALFARILPFPFICLISGASLADEIALKPDAAGYSGIVQPFVKEHCVTCHGPEKQKGKLRLDTLANDFGDPAVTAKWKEVVNSINGHEMPPEDELQPAPEAAAKFASWLEMELARAEIAKH